MSGKQNVTRNMSYVFRNIHFIKIFRMSITEIGFKYVEFGNISFAIFTLSTLFLCISQKLVLNILSFTTFRSQYSLYQHIFVCFV